MQKSFFHLIVFTIILFGFQLSLAAQEKSSDEKKPNIVVVGAKKGLEITKDVAVVVVGQTAKATWKTAKFAATKLIVPATTEIIQPLVVKSAPKASRFLVNQSGNVLQKAVPIAGKAVLTYLRYKLPF